MEIEEEEKSGRDNLLENIHRKRPPKLTPLVKAPKAEIESNEMIMFEIKSKKASTQSLKD